MQNRLVSGHYPKPTSSTALNHLIHTPCIEIVSHPLARRSDHLSFYGILQRITDESQEPTFFEAVSSAHPETASNTGADREIPPIRTPSSFPV